MSKVDAFFSGVAGFIIAGTIAAAIYGIGSLIYQSGYEDAEWCIRYEINCP